MRSIRIISNIKIVTDSTAYLPPDLIAKYDIRVVPARIHFGTVSYTEGVDITNEEFYKKLSTGNQIPTTSQPAVGDFLRVYSELARRGRPILSIHVSSKLSATVSSALAARSYLPDAQIDVIDSLSTVMGLGMITLAAARAADKGHSLPEITMRVAELIQRMNVLFAVDTLEYLRKGERIGGASALVGSLLNIKPILYLKDGRMEVLAKARTRARALRRLLELMEERLPMGTPAHVAVMHAQAAEEALVLEKEIRSRFNCAEVYFSEIGPTIGTHLGPGAVVLAFYSEQEPIRAPLLENYRLARTNKPFTTLAMI
jgi:DegV family protein with EDD domain